MGKLNDFRAKIADELNISEEVITNIPKVSIVGKNKIIIENYKNIIEFDKDLVRLASSIGIIFINGKNLEVLFMGDNTLIIGGIFCSLNYEEEK